MGLNTVTTYVFWNLDEPKPGAYDFTGSLDCRLLHPHRGDYVILRPGPYVSAEWGLGGLPGWLLADPNIVLRSSDEKFLGPPGRVIDETDNFRVTGKPEMTSYCRVADQPGVGK